MKNTIIVLLLVAAAAFGGLYFQEHRKTADADARVAALEQKVNELQASLDRKEEQAAGLRRHIEESRLQAETVATPTPVVANAPETAPSADSAAANTNHSSPLAEMFKNPEMRDMIKKQQKTVLSAMVDKNYAKLAADLNLTPEQTTKLKDLVMEKMLTGADLGMSMMSEDMDSAKRTELAKQIKTETDAVDEQIKQLLGDDAYKQFQTYEKTQGERTEINSFKEQLSDGTSALNPDQEQQLMDAMVDERQKFKFTTDYSDKSQMTGDWASYFSEDKINQAAQELDQLDQNYLSRAKQILSPEQYAAFEKFLSGQAAMQKMGLKMAASMFGGAKSAGK